MNTLRKRIIAGRHFLTLVLHLRTILLQDAVFLMEAHPKHPIFRHAVFRSSEFSLFAGRLRAAATSSIDPTTAAFQYVAPEVANAIRTTATALEGRMNVLGTTIENGFLRVQELVEGRIVHQVEHTNGNRILSFIFLLLFSKLFFTVSRKPKTQTCKQLIESLHQSQLRLMCKGSCRIFIPKIPLQYPAPCLMCLLCLLCLMCQPLCPLLNGIRRSRQ